jgi:tripartite-type tricarboxylate transporter receptor subunit TctC
VVHVGHPSTSGLFSARQLETAAASFATVAAGVKALASGRGHNKLRNETGRQQSNMPDKRVKTTQPGGPMSFVTVNQRAALAAYLMAGACALGIAAAPSQALAQAWPSKPITLVVPFAAGGPSDVVGRTIADHLGRTLGQQIIVENVGGAGGTLGMDRVAKADPDGYTLLTHHSGFTAAPALYSNLKFDAKTAFEPIGLVNTGPMVLLSRKTLETKDASALIAWIKEKGDKATIGFAGVGSNSFVCATLLHNLLGVKMSMVPYRGTGPAMTDLVGGQIDILCDQSTTATPQILEGTVKAYAVTSAQRSKSLPNVPTNAEAGMPGLEVTIWNALYAPKGTPKAVVDKINGALGKMLDDPAIASRFEATGTVAFPAAERTPEAQAIHVAKQFDFFKNMFAKAGVAAQEAK